MGSSPPVTLDVDTTPAAPTLRGARTILLISALVLTVLAFQLNASLLSPALPQMAASLGVSIAEISNVQSAFFLAASVLGMVISRWSDTIGRRRALFVSLGLLLIGSMLALATSSFALLLAARVLQGASSAAFTIAFLVLSEELTGKLFGVAVGVVTAVNGGLGGLDGYIGGALTDALGWRSLFAVILALGIVATVMAMIFVPGRRPAEHARMDWLGALVLAVLLVSLTQFIGAASSRGLGSGTLVLLAIVVLSAVLFIRVERRVRQPLIAVSALRSRFVWPVIASTFLTVAGVFSATNFTVVMLSQDVEVGYGLDATMSGLLFLTPAAVAGVVAATFAGWVAQRVGWVHTQRIATGILVVLMVLVALSATEQWVVFALLIITGAFYIGTFQTTANGLSVLNSPPDAPGSLPGINGAQFGLGAAAGIALVAPLADLATEIGYRSAFIVSAALVGGGLMCSLILKPAAAALPAATTKESLA